MSSIKPILEIASGLISASVLQGQNVEGQIHTQARSPETFILRRL